MTSRLALYAMGSLLTHCFRPALRARKFLSLIAVLSLSSLSSSGRHVPITVLHTTDLHGHILPSEDYEGNAGRGGLLACATIIEEVRSTEQNVVLVDCGDLVQGSMESWVTRGEIMTRALELLNYDAWVLGNHEFDWGNETLRRLHDGTSLNMLAANVSVESSSGNDLPKLRPFVIKDMDGIRVAIIGLTTPAVPRWIPREILGDAEFTSAVDVLPGVLRSVRTKEPDIIIAVVHQGAREFGDNDANEINAIASRFPELDLIVGGHTHQSVRSTTINGVLYTQAGYHGNWLGRVDLVYDTVKRRLIHREADLVPITDSVLPSESLRDALSADLEKASALATSEVGHTDVAIPSSLKLPAQSVMQQLISSAIAEGTGADVVLHGVFSEAGLSPGPITMADIWNIVPYENRLGVIRVTPAELRMILEENLDCAGSSHFFGIHGLGYELDVNAPEGDRVRNLVFSNGERPHGRQRLKVAANSYALASGGGRHPVLSSIARKPESRFEMTDIDTRTAVIDYVRKHSPLHLQEKDDVRLIRDGSR